MLVIWILGSIIIWRARRFHISATYVISFFCLRISAQLDHRRSLASRDRADHRTDVSALLFFMITDPKTTVRSKLGQCVVAFLRGPG